MASMAMVAALASCSKDVTTTPDDLNATKETAYAKVSLSFGSATRADDETFDEGIAKEREVKSVTLVVYDASGNAVGYGTIDTQNPDEQQKQNVSTIYKDKVVELQMINTSSDPKTVVAYINTSVNAEVPFNEAMQQVMKRSEIFNEDGTFVMTNSGYYGGTESKTWTVATDIAGIYGTAEAAAEGMATTIYVERLAAKVSVDLKKEEGSAKVETIAQGIKILGVDGVTEYQLDFDAKNATWAPTGIAQTMYVLKNDWKSEGDSSTDYSWAEANGNFRSYWAKGVYYDTQYSNMKANLDYVSYNEVIGEEESAEPKGNMGSYSYVTEHTYGSTTMGDPKYSPLGAATSAIVIGQYKVVKTSESGDGEEVEDAKFDNDQGEPDFYLLLTNVTDKVYTIFTEGELMEYLLKADKLELYGDGNDSEKTQITAKNAAEFFKLKWEDKKYSLEKKSEETKVYTKAEEGEDYTEYQNGFTAASNARHYNLGYAYFFAPIKHAETAEGEGEYGVVRNHVYNMTITSITSLGAPLDDDHFGKDGDDDKGDEPIEPDPDETPYIKVELKVLSWHVMSQDVEL